MLYKLDNGKLIKSAVVKHSIDGKEFVTTNPTTDFLVGLGYKPLETQEKPSVGQNERLVAVYTEQADKIVCSWKKEVVQDEFEN